MTPLGHNIDAVRAVWKVKYARLSAETGLHYSLDVDAAPLVDNWIIRLHAVRGVGERDTFYRSAETTIAGREISAAGWAGGVVDLVSEKLDALVDRVHDAEDTLVILARQVNAGEPGALDVLFDALAESGRVVPVDYGEDRKEAAIEANHRKTRAWAEAIAGVHRTAAALPTEKK